MNRNEKPLTLDELRKMNGKPLFGVSLITGKPGEYFICRIVNMGKTWFVACAGASQGFGDKDTYGETWVAYATEPPCIDRESWCAEWVTMIDDDGYVWLECSACEQGLDSLDEQHPFCPSCGRAMTTSAWKQLEERFVEK